MKKIYLQPSMKVRGLVGMNLLMGSGSVDMFEEPADATIEVEAKDFEFEEEAL